MGKTKEQIELTAKDRTAQALKHAEKGFQSLDDKLAGLLKGAAAFAGTAGLVAVTKQSLAAANEITRFSKVVGVSTQQLSAWGIAAKTVNIEQSKLNDILKDTAEKIGDAYANKGGEAVEILNRLGLQSVELARLSPDQQLLRIAEQLDNVGTQSEKIQILEGLASDASLLLPLLEDNAKELREITREAKDVGATFDSFDSEAIEKANRKVILLEEVLTKKLIKTVADNAETIGKLADNILDFADATGKAIQKTQEWSEKLGKTLATNLGGTEIDHIQRLNNHLNEVNKKIELFGSNVSDFQLQAWREQAKTVQNELDKLAQKRSVLFGAPVDSSTGLPAASASATQKAETASAAPAKKKINTTFSQPTNEDVVMFGVTEDKERERIERRLEAVALTLQTEEERLSTSFVKREMMVEKAFNNGYINEERRKELLLQLEQNYNDEVTRIQQESLSAQEQQWNESFQGKLNVVQGVLGQVSNLMQSENKKQFEIGKKAAIAQAVINTYQMAVNSYNALSGIPYVGPILGAIAAASAIAYGKAQISRIKSQQFGGGAAGGGAPQGTYSANPNTGAPTGSPAGGPTSVAGIDGTNQQQQSRRQINISIFGDSISPEQVRELIDKVNEETEDGVELNVAIG